MNKLQNFKEGFVDGDIILDNQPDSSRYIIVSNNDKIFVIGDNGERRQRIIKDGNMKFVPSLNKPALKGSLSLNDIKK